MARSAVNNRFLLRDMGQSATFNGTTSKIDVPHSTQLNITGSITIGCWVKINRVTGSGFNVFMCKGSNEPYELDYDQALNRFRFIIQTNNGFSTRQGTTDTAVLGKWVHIVGVYDNSGTPSNALYVNGQSISSGTLTGTSLVTNSTALGIGYRSGSNDRFAPCQIDEPFVYPGAMTAAQIQDIYYKGVYPSGLAFLSYLNTNANDASGNGNNGTATSVTYTADVPITPRTAVSGRFLLRDMGKSISLNGSTDRFTLPFTPSVTAFGFGFWLRPTTLTSAARLIDYSDGGPSGGFTIQVNSAQPQSRLEYVIYNAGTQQANLLGQIKLGQWVHIGATYSSNNAKFYINGVNVATDTSCTMTAPTQTLSICRRSNGSSNFFGAEIDDFMFVNGRQISDTEMSDHYLMGVVPTDTTCRLNFNDNVTDQTGNGNNATLTGTSYSTNVPLAMRTAA